MAADIFGGGFGIDTQSLGESNGGAKRGLVDIGKKIAAEVDGDGAKGNGIGVFGIFFNQRIGTIDDGYWGRIDQFGLFGGDLIEGGKILKMNRRDI